MSLAAPTRPGFGTRARTQFRRKPSRHKQETVDVTRAECARHAPFLCSRSNSHTAGRPTHRAISGSPQEGLSWISPTDRTSSGSGIRNLDRAKRYAQPSRTRPNWSAVRSGFQIVSAPESDLPGAIQCPFCARNGSEFDPESENRGNRSAESAPNAPQVWLNSSPLTQPVGGCSLHQLPIRSTIPTTLATLRRPSKGPNPRHFDSRKA